MRKDLLQINLEKNWFKIAIVVILVFLAFFLNNYFQSRNQLARDQFEQQKEQKDKEFEADQKAACLAIYKQEAAKWNNVDGWRYDSSDDRCFVQYKDTPKKTETQCDSQYQGADGKVPSFLISDWILCTEGLFEKSF